MSRSAYCRVPCGLCGKLVSTAGFAHHMHMMKHVREGRMRRTFNPYGPKFELTLKEAVARYDAAEGKR